MKPTIEILDRISENSRNNKEEIFTRLYRYMLRPDLYYLAYKNLYANKGASTKGVDEDTADGFSTEKVNKVIATLADESYRPKPVRREYIKKKNNSKKKRPLGLPTFTDKLVQEVLRMILEAVYEPIFSTYSHGFRPKRSCHTALNSLKKEFTGVSWFIEGDIKGCFDNIDHHVLVDIINSKIKDARLIKLIWKFLKSGYMEDWTYHKTYSGCPQGGIASPILANIYLNELDKFAEKSAEEFYKPKDKARNTEYRKIAGRKERAENSLKTAKGQRKTELLKQIKLLKSELRTIPYTSKTDKAIKYVRYAVDFIIGVKGDKVDCEQIKQQFSEFIGNALKMELSDEKTLITHSNQYARFLGYDIRVRRDNTVKPHGSSSRRTLNYSVELNVPFADRIMPFLFDKAAIKQHQDGTIEPIARKCLYRCTDLEIIDTYNSELRGLCNFYGIASNFVRLNYFAYLMEYSCLKTLAGKHGGTTRKMINKFHVKNVGWGIPYETAKGKKYRAFAKYADCKNSDSFNDVIENDGVVEMAAFQNVYDDLKAKLVGKGVPAGEIAFIHDADTETRKKELFARVRKGQIRILLGSTQKMGAGTNVQDRLIALHDLDCPWRPSDLQQRLGRVVRQGNKNPEVEIYRYVTESTFDSYLYQLVENKQKFIAQVMTGKTPVRVAEDVDETALSYAEIKALATGNPLIIEKCQLDMDVNKLKLLHASHLSQRYSLEDMILKRYPQKIQQLTERIAGYQADAETVAKHQADKEHLGAASGFPPMKIGGILYTDKADAGKAIIEACKAMSSPDPVALGEYRGFAMILSYDTYAKDYRITLSGALSHTVTLGTDIHGNITRLDNRLEQCAADGEADKKRLAETEAQLEAAKGEVERPFPQEQEYQEKSLRLKEVNSLLNMDEKDNTVFEAEPDEGKMEPPSKVAGLER